MPTNAAMAPLKGATLTENNSDFLIPLNDTRLLFFPSGSDTGLSRPCMVQVLVKADARDAKSASMKILEEMSTAVKKIAHGHALVGLDCTSVIYRGRDGHFTLRGVLRPWRLGKHKLAGNVMWGDHEILPSPEKWLFSFHIHVASNV